MEEDEKEIEPSLQSNVFYGKDSPYIPNSSYTKTGNFISSYYNMLPEATNIIPRIYKISKAFYDEYKRKERKN